MPKPPAFFIFSRSPPLRCFLAAPWFPSHLLVSLLVWLLVPVLCVRGSFEPLLPLFRQCFWAFFGHFSILSHCRYVPRSDSFVGLQWPISSCDGDLASSIVLRVWVIGGVLSSSSAPIAATAPPSVRVSHAQTSAFALASLVHDICFLIGPLSEGTPLSLCFGSQVSIRSLLVFFQFRLLPSFYGQLGCDLQTTGLEFELACRFILLYIIIIVCGPSLSLSIPLASYGLVYWHEFPLIVVSNKGVSLVVTTLRSAASPFMLRGHRVQALWPMVSPMNLIFRNGYRLFVKQLVLVILLDLFAVCWTWWRGSQLSALFYVVPNSCSALLLCLLSCWYAPWSCCALQNEGLCVTNLIEFGKPQSSIVFPLVYDVAYLCPGFFHCPLVLFSGSRKWIVNHRVTHVFDIVSLVSKCYGCHPFLNYVIYPALVRGRRLCRLMPKAIFLTDLMDHLTQLWNLRLIFFWFPTVGHMVMKHAVGSFSSLFMVRILQSKISLLSIFCAQLQFSSPMIASLSLVLRILWGIHLLYSVSVLADYFWQRTTFFCSLFLPSLDCNDFVLFWNTLNCSYVLCVLMLWQPNLKLFLPLVCNGFISIACWPMYIASNCLYCWLLSYYTAAYVILSPPFYLTFGVNLLFWSGPFPFLFYLELDCWVWRSVVQRGCFFLSFPSSDHGVFPLVCCWKDNLFFGLWLFLWLSVTSSCKPGQPKLQVLFAMACDVLECVEYYSEANVCTSPPLLGLCWHQTYCYLRVILWLLLPLSVFCPAFNFGFLLSSYDMFGTFLSRVMVRDGKMRILRSKASPLPGSCTHWFSSDTYFMPALLELGSYFIPWIVLCLVLLDLARFVSGYLPIFGPVLLY